jgi:hypothetical protein
MDRRARCTGHGGSSSSVVATVVRDGLVLTVPLQRTPEASSKLKRLERQRKYDPDVRLVGVLRELTPNADEELNAKNLRRTVRAKAEQMMRPEADQTLLQSYAVAEKPRARYKTSLEGFGCTVGACLSPSRS